MKIVALDGYVLNPGDLSWAELEPFGELHVHERIGYDDVCQPIKPLEGA